MNVPGVEVFTGCGLQVPVIAGLLVEELGNVIGVEFWQSGLMGLKVGTTGGFTTMFMVAWSAHWPASGVKV